MNPSLLFRINIFLEVKESKDTGARCGGFIPPKIKDTSSGEGFSLATAIRLLFSPLWLIIVTVYIFGHLLNFYGAGNVEHLARMHLPGKDKRKYGILYTSAGGCVDLVDIVPRPSPGDSVASSLLGAPFRILKEAGLLEQIL